MALNIPLAEPDGIVSEAGTLMLVELALRPTVPPPDPLRVTVQALEESGPIVPGLQAMAPIPDIAGGATSERVAAVEEPFSVPVTVTV